MKYKCPECRSEDLTEIVQYTIWFDMPTGKELKREASDEPPEYECRNCREFIPYGKLLREYKDERTHVKESIELYSSGLAVAYA